MEYEKPHLSIKHWAEEDQPREKLINKGKNALSDAELLAILIRTGSKQESALDLAKRMLATANHNLQVLGKYSIEELMSFHGVKMAKAVTIAAALELGRRRQLADIKDRPQIKSSRDAYEVIAAKLMDLPHEEFWILLLNRSNCVLQREQISLGGTAGTVVDAKIVFKKAIQGQASSIILVHNHPSGNLTPSQADIGITKKLKVAGEMLDIAVLDHLIIAEKGYYSFADEGLM
ncbi:MAG: DNA repair protein RadC [Saprospiraceae bacterium]|nr:DNA repair protein RadC [Saprospiraceae bacterium]